MKLLTNLFSRTVKAKGIPSLTEFLVTNPMFRKIVISFHNTKASAISDVDSYLEKELMNKTSSKKGPTKRLDRTCDKTNRQ